MAPAMVLADPGNCELRKMHSISLANAKWIEEMKTNKKPSTLFCRVSDAFRVFARATSNVLGSASAFVVACAIIGIWAATGPTFHYSDTWQLIINTGTTIVTFLMVFLIQNTQNRDARAAQLKLDELIRALGGARNRLVNLEKLSDEELLKLEQEFQRLRASADKAPEDQAASER